jgi:hypothetical protein
VTPHVFLVTQPPPIGVTCLCLSHHISDLTYAYRCPADDLNLWVYLYLYREKHTPVYRETTAYDLPMTYW